MEEGRAFTGEGGSKRRRKETERRGKKTRICKSVFLNVGVYFAQLGFILGEGCGFFFFGGTAAKGGQLPSHKVVNVLLTHPFGTLHFDSRRESLKRFSATFFFPMEHCHGAELLPILALQNAWGFVGEVPLQVF